MKLKNSVYNLVEYKKDFILEAKDAIEIHSNKMNLFIDIKILGKSENIRVL